MKVLCTDRNCIGAALTVGKEYDVTKETEIYYYMVDDAGKVTGFYKDHFEPINTYSLTLSEDEMSVLVIISGSVLGNDKNNPREHATSAHFKLRNALGVRDCTELREYNMTTRNNSYIEFKDYPATKTPQQLKIEELEATINEAQRQLQELKGL